jgi:hypothetical protein
LDAFTKTNQTGISPHIVHSASFPVTRTRRRLTFFHITKPDKGIKKPPEEGTYSKRTSKIMALLAYGNGGDFSKQRRLLPIASTL